MISHPHFRTLMLLAASALFTASAPAQPKSDSVSLFNGKSIDNWTVKGGTAKYHVEDGTIVGTTVEKSKNTFLSTKRDYADFELEVMVLCDRELNSGIQIRSHVYEKPTPQASKKERMREQGE